MDETADRLRASFEPQLTGHGHGRRNDSTTRRLHARSVAPASRNRTKADRPLSHPGTARRRHMGEVYKAERRSPMRQIVAIKIIKLALTPRSDRAISSERQALPDGSSQHRQGARAGVSETGRHSLSWNTSRRADHYVRRREQARWVSMHRAGPDRNLSCKVDVRRALTPPGGSSPGQSAFARGATCA